MRLYGHPYSTCTRKVMITLAEKKQDFEFVLVDLMHGEHKQPEHLQRHPFGVIPLLEDKGFSLFESRAIIRYLDRRFPEPRLSPEETQAYGLMEQWISVEQSYFAAPAVKIFKQRILAPMQGLATDASAVEIAIREVERTLDVAEDWLKQHTYFSGKTFTLADISWMPYVAALETAQASELIEKRSACAAWWKRVQQRPSWQAVLERSKR